MKKLVVLVGISLAGITAVKAQGPGTSGWIGDKIYAIGNENMGRLIFDFNEIAEVGGCGNPLRMDPQGKSGFYFEKPIMHPIMKGIYMEFNLQRRGNLFYEFCGLPATTPNNIEFKVDGALKLKISGSDGRIYIPSYTSLIFGETSGEGNNRISLIQYGPHGYIDYKDNLHFRTDGDVAALTLYGNGSVGIGFTATYNVGQYLNMGHKLAVKGGIICEEITVINNIPDADYVFEEDYKLTPLAEVESFIKENKHLPDIPSAEEFKTNGYKVGDMDGMLLRKIEELTLYIIELEKQVKELQQKVNEK